MDNAPEFNLEENLNEKNSDNSFTVTGGFSNENEIENEEQYIRRSSEYFKAHIDYSANQEIARTYLDAMEGLGTSKKLLNEANSHLTKYNVCEVFEAFKNINSKGDNLIEYIYDEFTKWGGEFGDEARDYVMNIVACLESRVNDLMENPKLERETKYYLKDVSSDLTKAIKIIEEYEGDKNTAFEFGSYALFSRADHLTNIILETEEKFYNDRN